MPTSASECLVAFQSLMLSFQQPVNSLVDFGSTLKELEGDLNRLDMMF
jgi:ATP-binding cassette subfamily C protein